MSRHADLSESIGTHLQTQRPAMDVGFRENVRRFQPPLTVSRDRFGRTVERLREAIEADLEDVGA